MNATHTGDTSRCLPSLPATILVALTLPFAGHAQTIIDDDFDAPDVTGWIGQGNTRTFSAQSITQENSVLTSEVAASQSNTNRGIVSETSFEPAATGGFSLTFVVDAVNGQPGANGFFIGIVRDNDIFHRELTTKNFGLAFYGQDPRTASVGGFGIVYGDNNGATPADFILGDSNAQGDVDLASFQDGFTATVNVDPAGWSYEMAGLQDSLSTDTEFTGAGTWDDAGTDFDTLFPAADTWFVTGAIQVVPATTYSLSFDRITLVGGAGAGSPTFPLSITRNGDAFDLAWQSKSGMLYNVMSSGDLATWTLVEGDIPATPDTNTKTVTPPILPALYYRVEEFPKPPVVIYSEDFDGSPDLPEGWTTGANPADTGTTQWQLGAPSPPGPAAANSGTNCVGTNLTAAHGISSDTWLRTSATIDLTNATSANLLFQHWIDMDDFDFGDTGSVRVLDAAGLPGTVTELGVVKTNIQGLTPAGWVRFSARLPAAALGKTVAIEFRFASDAVAAVPASGWYIDDVTVSAQVP